MGNRPVAQLAERRSPKPKVGGSIPPWPVLKKGGMWSESVDTCVAYWKKGSRYNPAFEVLLNIND